MILWFQLMVASQVVQKSECFISDWFGSILLLSHSPLQRESPAAKSAPDTDPNFPKGLGHSEVGVSLGLSLDVSLLELPLACFLPIFTPHPGPGNPMMKVSPLLLRTNGYGSWMKAISMLLNHCLGVNQEYDKTSPPPWGPENTYI